VAALSPDLRLRRVHYDWLEAGEHAQRTVARLSQQLRRFLDDQAWLENRRIMDLLHGIEAKALALRDARDEKGVAHALTATTALAAGHSIDGLHPEIELPFERPLFGVTAKAVLANAQPQAGETDADASALFSQIRVDKAALSAHVRQSLQSRAQISLGELLQTRPLQQGLSELVAYLQLASVSAQSVVDEQTQETVQWLGADGIRRSAQLPRVIFVRT
jgi:Protein of unknown function (DUF3375)